MTASFVRQRAHRALKQDYDWVPVSGNGPAQLAKRIGQPLTRMRKTQPVLACECAEPLVVQQ
ncbi:hypothetical protein [Kibdelosporangium aridum]|uniref:hypothetical protein n=1 Tax=Kibdelosporangium aridum TaxID=2030 RepID=UPI0005253F44